MTATRDQSSAGLMGSEKSSNLTKVTQLLLGLDPGASQAPTPGLLQPQGPLSRRQEHVLSGGVISELALGADTQIPTPRASLNSRNPFSHNVEARRANLGLTELCSPHGLGRTILPAFSNHRDLSVPGLGPVPPALSSLCVSVGLCACSSPCPSLFYKDASRWI